MENKIIINFNGMGNVKFNDLEQDYSMVIPKICRVLKNLEVWPIVHTNVISRSCFNPNSMAVFNYLERNYITNTFDAKIMNRDYIFEFSELLHIVPMSYNGPGAFHWLGKQCFLILFKESFKNYSGLFLTT